MSDDLFSRPLYCLKRKKRGRACWLGFLFLGKGVLVRVSNRVRIGYGLGLGLGLD